MEALEKIKENDPQFYRELTSLINYFASTYDDKYASNDKVIDTKHFLYHNQFGKGANMFTAAKYIQRYCTTGFKKSENVIDLYKSVHYIIFELIRKTFYEPTRVDSNNKD